MMNRVLSILFAACVVAAPAGPAISVEESVSGDPIVVLLGLGCRGDVWNAVAQRVPGRRSLLVSQSLFQMAQPAGKQKPVPATFPVKES